MPESHATNPSKAAAVSISIPTAEEFVYFNGLAVAYSPGDIVITLIRNNAPVITLNASFVVAKLLGKIVTDTVSQYEIATGQVIPDFADLSKAIQPLVPK